MPEFRVVWEIDIVAGDPREAARKAWEIQQCPDNTACVFVVTRRFADGVLSDAPDTIDVLHDGDNNGEG